MMPLVVQVEDLQTGSLSKSVYLKSPIRIGRSELNDLPLLQGFVSQWHAVVQFDEQHMEYVDLGSTNGSIIDGVRMERNVPVPITQETAIQIGALKLTFLRKSTGVHRAPPKTMFAIRAATGFSPATPSPGTVQPAAAAPPAPPSTSGTLGTPIPVSKAPAPQASARFPSSPALEPSTSEAAAPPPVAPDRPLAISEAPLSAPAQPFVAPSSDRMDSPSPPVLDLPTDFRMNAVVPATASPSPARNPEPRPSDNVPSAGPVLDLPTEFRMAAIAAPPSPEPSVADLNVTASPISDRLPSSAAPPLAAEAPPTARTPATVPPGAPSPRAGAAHGAPSPRAPAAQRPSGSAHDVDRLLAMFAESYLPATVQVQSFDDIQTFLGKLAETIEAFARAFVEMRKGYEEFGKQMGIRTVHGEGLVARSRDPRQLLAALLDPSQQGRASDLQAAFADYMVHQVALLNGVVEGAKSIVTQLSPESIEAESPHSRWPMKAQSLWKTFEERYQELFEEDNAISDALFGREFGKAYTAIIGRGGAAEVEEEDDDDEDEDDRRSKKKRSASRRR